MRTLKCLAAGFILTLAGAVYVAGAMQDADSTKETVKATKNCCMKQDAAPAAKQHGGEGCCSADRRGRHKGAHAGAQKAAVSGEKAGCCSAGSCSEGGGEDCCKEGAACCKGGKECCKTHKPATTQSAAAGAVKGGTDAGCCAGSCACCGGQSDHKAQTGGR